MKRLKHLLQSNNFFRVIALLALIYSLVLTLLPNYKSKYKGTEEELKLTVLDIKIDGNKLTLNLLGKEKLVGTYYIKTKEEKEWYENNIEIGDKVHLKGKLVVPEDNTIPNAFNYKKYLYQNKIYYTLNISEIKILDKTNNIFYKIKNYAYNRANNIKNNKYIYAYILGSTDGLDNSVLNSYRTNGVSHLFALSGLHVGIFSMVLLSILKKLKIKDIITYIIIFLVLLLFSFITGFSSSMLRSTLLFFLLGINKIYKLEVKTINILYLVFTILLMINPFTIYSASFILSFTTTFFLMLGSEMLQNKNYIKTLFAVSALSFVSSIGVSIYFFGSINPLGILLNLIFVPFVSFIVFPLALIVYICPFLINLLVLFTNIMEYLSLKFATINMTIYFPNINIYTVLIYYILLTISLKTKNKKILIFMLSIIIVWKVYPYFNDETIIYFIDVGQGDSALLVTPHKKHALLMDTGGSIKYKKEPWEETKTSYNIATDSLIPFMRSIGVYKLDYLIITHGDTDHGGSAVDLVKNFQVSKVIFNCGSYNDLENKLIKVLDMKNIKYYSCIKELNIDNNKLYFLNTKDYDNENDNSSVIYTELNNYKFLFMGDASILTEKEILNKYNLPNIDMLKVGHHGSKTSSSEEFIDTINPKFSIINVGKNNRYGHPNKEVLDTLDNSKIYRTDIDGSIMFKIKKDKLNIGTCPP